MPAKHNKRALKEDNCSNGNVVPKKRKGDGPDTSSSQGSNLKTPTQKIVWPEYFNELFKVYKALNTVLAFCSSRRHLATTFPVVRSSVEALLHGPLDLEKVAQIKALLPDLVKFAYIPQSQHRINSIYQPNKGKERVSLPDYPLNDESHKGNTMMEEDEHVLVLDFAEIGKGRKAKDGQGNSVFSSLPSLSPTAVKNLIERRNERFSEAVYELLAATSLDESPVELLQAAARDHIPIEPRSRILAKDKREDSMALNPIPDSDGRPSIEQVLREITGRQSDDYEKDDLNEFVGMSWYHGQIAYRRTFEAIPAQFGTLDVPLSSTIVDALQKTHNIHALYTHQTSAINALGQSRHVVVSTRTASGKSVIYQVPLLRFLEEDQAATAIFVYPTKALAQDQRKALELLLYACSGLEHIQVATYDGDSSQEERRRENTKQCISHIHKLCREHLKDLTSHQDADCLKDMLHASILPHEDLWRSFLKNLRIFAVDELHYYTSLLGTHVAMVMRRFRRLCAAVGNRRCAFVSCSATINNPEKHARNIFGLEDIQVITDDGAASGKKDFIIWNPAPVDSLDPSAGHQSPMHEAVTLMCFFMRRGIKTILFCKIRKICELTMRAVRTQLSLEGRTDVLGRVMAYRGGYSPEDRRRIEQEAFSGNLLGIIATTALELGIDIGALDAVIMLGFPRGNLPSFRQQAGRAGRRSRDSLVVLIADNSPVDRYYVNHPEALFDNPTPDLLLDLESKVILEAHLQCAGHEMPLSLEDEQYFGPLFRELCETYLIKDSENWYHTHPRYLPYPAKNVSIRGIEEERYTVIDITKVGQPDECPKILEEIELSRALFETYEGAVFLHQGQTFLVKEVSHDTRIAKLMRTDVSWITRPRDFTDVDAKETYRIREITQSPQKSFYGRVDVKTTIFGYFKVRNNIILDVVDLETPSFERETTGTWVDIPKGIITVMLTKGLNPAEGIHSAAHAVMNRFSMAADLATECKVPKKEYMSIQSSRKRPGRLIFYDKAKYGAGVAAKAFDRFSSLVHETWKVVEDCPCEDGCVNCIDDPNCKESNEVSSKAGAKVILRGILGLSLGLEEFPDVEPSEIPQTSIIEAEAVHVADDADLRGTLYGL